ncbi:uncharacterized protein LOC112045457 [Bicyclus anynana]|uniref:Uncharacterized protein LOC112045457 n=1 Tax=Bicyclus anynana TaxID=110368 RepID=A0ABM3LPT6_BICAN|nr:uncharacterized protein LOC112045457 [Bicyclus anynana]
MGILVILKKNTNFQLLRVVWLAQAHSPGCLLQEYVNKLKASTKQLLCLLEEIQSKTHAKDIIPDKTPKLTNHFKSDLQVINEHDSCTIYNRLTRKCYCLNHPDYNDFVIHFNENSKYTTSNLGEMIKNIRILRKFLYMGCNYTKNALMFLNEGMMESPHSERVEMTQACVNADICNIFDDHSIVIVCISWPCKNKHFGDYVTQALAAGFLYKLAQVEEGRRYLNYSSKITNDIKKVLRKKSALIEVNTVESLNATLNLLKPVFVKNVPKSHFKQSIYEGKDKKKFITRAQNTNSLLKSITIYQADVIQKIRRPKIIPVYTDFVSKMSKKYFLGVGKRTVYDLVQHRKYMTCDEILMHLEMLESYSEYDGGRPELILHLPLILILFKHLIIEYDNSEINVTITSILNNIVSKNNTIHAQESDRSNTDVLMLAERGTQVL